MVPNFADPLDDEMGSASASAPSAAAAAAATAESITPVYLSESELLFGVDDAKRGRLGAAGRELVDRLAADFAMQAEDDVNGARRVVELLDYVVYHVDCGHIVEVGQKGARFRGKLRVRGVPCQPQL